jgi:hypothetical protein
VGVGGHAEWTERAAAGEHPAGGPLCLRLSVPMVCCRRGRGSVERANQEARTRVSEATEVARGGRNCCSGGHLHSPKWGALSSRLCCRQHSSVVCHSMLPAT